MPASPQECAAWRREVSQLDSELTLWSQRLRDANSPAERQQAQHEINQLGLQILKLDAKINTECPPIHPPTSGVFAYVTSFGANIVSVIDTASNAVVATVPVGGDPRRVAISPDGKFAYVTHDLTADIFVIDTATNTVAATITIPGTGFWVAFTPDGKKAYVTAGGISVIDTAANTIVATVSLPVTSATVAVAIAPDGQRAYVTDRLNGSVW